MYLNFKKMTFNFYIFTKVWLGEFKATNRNMYVKCLKL